MKGNEKRITALLCLGLLLSGCGMQTLDQTAQEETVELLSPVTSAVNTEMAACRNLYDARIYSASVFPYTEEYSLEDNQRFAGYGAYLGQQVVDNGGILYADTSTLNQQIEDMEEQLKTMEEDFQEYRDDLLAELAEPRAEAGRLEKIVEEMENSKPEADLEDDATIQAENGVVSGGNAISNSYAEWQKNFTRFEGDYRVLAHSVAMREEELRQRTQLYELDHAYQERMLQNKREEREDAILRSGMNGEVVALAQLSYQDNMPGQTPMAAVGDTSQKVLKCDYISKTLVNGAKDLYALIDGVRVEITYQPMEVEEYNRLAEENDKVYSTFTLENADVADVGDFAVIALVSDKREQVLSVPKDTIHKDEAGSFVYLQKEGDQVKTPVKTGMTDGVYTEILSGLEEGDAVVLPSAGASVEDPATAVIEKGNFHSSYEEMGTLYYPSASWVTNTLSYGTVYFQEYFISLYQEVQEGDLIARVRVVPDEVELERQQVKLQRLQERLAELRKLGEEENRKAIASREEEIASVEEIIQEMREDYSVQEIYASADGIVTRINEYEPEELLKKDAWLVEIADTGRCYVAVENTNQLLNYGNQMTVAYQDREGNACTAEGKVANLSNAGVSRSLQSEASMILLPSEVVAEMIGATQKQNSWWGNLYQVSGVIREMDQVVVVPKKAVTDTGGQTYVQVKDPSGEIRAISFLAGGYDSEYYWVVEGLTEGMEICLE